MSKGGEGGGGRVGEEEAGIKDNNCGVTAEQEMGGPAVSFTRVPGPVPPCLASAAVLLWSGLLHFLHLLPPALLPLCSLDSRLLALPPPLLPLTLFFFLFFYYPFLLAGGQFLFIPFSVILL